jgi:beta-mannosidase
MPAEVPGHVHDDLVRAGVIPDPFRRMNERGVQWVDETDWEYETTFAWDEAPGDVVLRFEGLDTIAEVYLNDESLGTSDCMFAAVEFPVTGRLKPGANVLRVVFRSARRIGRRRQEEWHDSGEDTMPRAWNVWDERAFVRKAQYMYGWDWGPELASCGIWKPVSLVRVPVARLTGWRHEVAFEADGSATVRFEATAERASGAGATPLTLKVTLDGRSAEAPVSEAGDAVVAMRVPQPRRWEPNGSGEPFLYPVGLTLLQADDVADEIVARIGFRTIELVREADDSGEGFLFRVNGRDTFMKGANWVPADSFPSRLERPEGRERVRRLLQMARESGLNMLRVWGGGLYESDDFYDLCDELGILVWQDFAYACAYYPDTGAYAEAAGREAVAAVRRLRNHPSLALWCGNNENHVAFHEGWGGPRPPRYFGERLYHNVLPKAVAREDPARTYWPSSPFGGDNPNSPDTGDRHNWDIWHGSGDWTRYALDRSRFVSEFGFAGSCGLRAWRSVLEEGDRSADSPAVRWHDKTRKGYDTYLGYIEAFFPRPSSLEDLVYYSQANQAEALKFGVEHYRRLKGRCWGTLFWQWNDCWPVQSWAAVDYAGDGKFLYHAARRFYAPLLVSLVREGGQAVAWLVNDSDAAVCGRLQVSLQTWEGAVLAASEADIAAGANVSVEAARLDLSAAVGREREVFAHASFISESGGAVENILFLARPKELALPEPGLRVVSVQPAAGGTFSVRLRAERFAAWVWLRLDGAAAEWSDNGFHVLPGQERVLTLCVGDGLTAPDVAKALAIRSLGAAGG